MAAGTLRKIVLDSTNFNASGDIDTTQNQTTVNTAEATSGDVMHVITKQVASLDSVTVSCDGLDYALLKGLHDKLAPFAMSIVTADGDTFTSTGRINIEGRTTANNVATVQLLPDGDWDFFAG